VQRRRLFPVKLVQRFQVAVQNRVLKPAVSGAIAGIESPLAHPAARSQCLAAALAGADHGTWRAAEHVRSPGPRLRTGIAVTERFAGSHRRSARARRVCSTVRRSGCPRR